MRRRPAIMSDEGEETMLMPQTDRQMMWKSNEMIMPRHENGRFFVKYNFFALFTFLF